MDSFIALFSRNRRNMSESTLTSHLKNLQFIHEKRSIAFPFIPDFFRQEQEVLEILSELPHNKQQSCLRSLILLLPDVHTYKDIRFIGHKHPKIQFTDIERLFNDEYEYVLPFINYDGKISETDYNRLTRLLAVALLGGIFMHPIEPSILSSIKIWNFEPNDNYFDGNIICINGQIHFIPDTLKQLMLTVKTNNPFDYLFMYKTERMKTFSHIVTSYFGNGIGVKQLRLAYIQSQCG